MIAKVRSPNQWGCNVVSSNVELAMTICPKILHVVKTKVGIRKIPL